MQSVIIDCGRHVEKRSNSFWFHHILVKSYILSDFALDTLIISHFFHMYSFTPADHYLVIPKPKKTGYAKAFDPQKKVLVTSLVSINVNSSGDVLTSRRLDARPAS